MVRVECIFIGASAGGMKALNVILPAFPKDFPIPIVCLLHTRGGYKSLLREIYQEKVKLQVKEPFDKEPLKAGTIYFAPPDYHTLVEKDRSFSFSVEDPVKWARPSIDVLFESAASAYGRRGAGVILTGANDDGADGLAAMTKVGAITIVQDPQEAEVSSMPLAAVRAAAPQFVLKVSEIAKFLTELPFKKLLITPSIF